jgi:hypothetical protein
MGFQHVQTGTQGRNLLSDQQQQPRDVEIIHGW